MRFPVAHAEASLTDLFGNTTSSHINVTSTWVPAMQAFLMTYKPHSAGKFALSVALGPAIVTNNHTVVVGGGDAAEFAVTADATGSADVPPLLEAAALGATVAPVSNSSLVSPRWTRLRLLTPRVSTDEQAQFTVRLASLDNHTLVDPESALSLAAVVTRPDGANTTVGIIGPAANTLLFRGEFSPDVPGVWTLCVATGDKLHVSGSPAAVTVTSGEFILHTLHGATNTSTTATMTAPTSFFPGGSACSAALTVVVGTPLMSLPCEFVTATGCDGAAVTLHCIMPPGTCRGPATTSRLLAVTLSIHTFMSRFWAPAARDHSCRAGPGRG